MGAVALLVVLGGVGSAWAASQARTATACTLGMAIDPVGASTAQGARVRFAADLDLGFDVDRPDERSESADRSTAIYLLDGPERGPADPSRTYNRKLGAERGADGVWRVVDANRCERWTD
jgi:hypothetical protein